MAASWPFVGRADELGLIDTAMGDLTVPGLLLAGDAGVGKTRLLFEAVRLADTRRFEPRVAVATASTATIPFGALAPLLPDRLPTQDNAINALRLAAEALTRPTDGRRVVLAIDDLQLLDDASATLVHQVALNNRAFILGAVRTSEPVPERITALWKDDLLRRLEIRTPSRGDFADLLAEVLGGAVSDATRRRLWEVTGGNLLYARELVGAGLATEALTEIEGMWRWVGAWVMPDQLRELLCQRIGELSPDEQDAMELLAIGAPVTTRVLERIIDPAVVRSLERKHAIWVREEGEREQVYPAHPLYGEILRAQCPRLRTRDQMRRLAEASEAEETRPAASDESTRPADDCLRIAVWRLDAGDDDRLDRETLVCAMRRAWLRGFDLELSDRLARAAIRAGVGVEAYEILWQTLYLRQRTDEAIELLDQIPAADLTPDLVVGRACNFFWGKDDGARGHAILKEAKGSAAERLRYDGMRSAFHAISGEIAPALELSERVIRESATGSHAEALGLSSYYCALVQQGRAAYPEDIAAARARTRRSDDQVPFVGWWMEFTHLQSLLTAGRLWEAEELADEGLEVAHEHGPDIIRYIFRGARARIARVRGEVATAYRLVQEELGLFRLQETGGHLIPGFLLGELAHVQAMLGRPSDAAKALREADARMRASAWAFETEVGLARSWIALAAGDRTGAVDLAIGVANQAARRGATLLEVTALHDAVRMDAVGLTERLVTACADLPGEWNRLVAAFAEALEHRDADALEQVARRFDRLGATLHAAEAYAKIARIHTAAGRATASRAAETRARILLDRCEGARLLTTDLAGAPALTAREREVATLAARGLSTRDIADHLVVSHRTVDNHLHQIYTKLGIRGRSSLGGLFDVEHPERDRGRSVKADHTRGAARVDGVDGVDRDRIGHRP